MIEIKNINKKYDEKIIFDNFSINLTEGEITVILGESGTGKTTFLKILSGIEKFEGKIENLPENASFVFQEDRLLPFKTVEENLVFALGKGEYDQALKSVGLEGEKNKYPDELSGGMARRVALLRAFLFKSELMLMDEPFSSLDIAVKYKLMNLFLDMWKKDRRTTVLVTHNIDEALYLGKRIVILGKNGKILFDRSNCGENLREEIIGIFMENEKQ